MLGNEILRSSCFYPFLLQVLPVRSFFRPRPHPLTASRFLVSRIVGLSLAMIKLFGRHTSDFEANG